MLLTSHSCSTVYTQFKNLKLVTFNLDDVTKAESYLCTHDESYEEGDYRHAQNQQLSAVASPKGLWVHVHHGCH